MPSTKQALNSELLELRGIPFDILDIWCPGFSSGLFIHLRARFIQDPGISSSFYIQDYDDDGE